MIDTLDIKDVQPYDFESDGITTTIECTPWGKLSKEDQDRLLAREKEIDKRVLTLYKKCVKKFYPEGVYNRIKMLEQYPMSTHYMVFGERGPGKTTDEYVYDCCYYYITGRTIGYITRHENDQRPGVIGSLFDNFNEYPYIQYIFKKDGWEGLELLPQKGRRVKGFYFYKTITKEIIDKQTGETYDEEERVYDKKPFYRLFALNMSGDYKGKGYLPVGRVYFDEFIPENKLYLTNEFTAFNSVLSSIRRKRFYVRCMMTANTVDRDCPYFFDLQIPEAIEIEQGRISYKTFGDVPPYLHSIVYERTEVDPNAVDEFHHYDNPNSRMMLDGEWETGEYPHITKEMSYSRKDIIFSYYIIYRDKVYECDIVSIPIGTFTFIFRKKGEVEDKDSDLYFSLDLDDNSPRWNQRTKINAPYDKVGRSIWSYFIQDKVFYKDNTVGDTIAAYLRACNKR